MQIKVLKVLLIMDILLLLSGLGWIVFGPHLSGRLIAFNRPISPAYFGFVIVLIGLYQGFRLRRAYLHIRKVSG